MLFVPLWISESSPILDQVLVLPPFPPFISAVVTLDEEISTFLPAFFVRN